MNLLEMLEVFKFFFFIMFSVNYNFMSNIKDSSEKDIKEIEVVDLYFILFG